MAEKDKALLKAIEIAGNGEKLAEKLGITPQALSQWDRVPMGRVLDVERVTGIPRAELRPDFFVLPASKKRSAA